MELKNKHFLMEPFWWRCQMALRSKLTQMGSRLPQDQMALRCRCLYDLVLISYATHFQKSCHRFLLVLLTGHDERRGCRNSPRWNKKTNQECKWEGCVVQTTSSLLLSYPFIHPHKAPVPASAPASAPAKQELPISPSSNPGHLYMVISP